MVISLNAVQKVDKFQMFLGSCSLVYAKGMELCKEKGYSFFTLQTLSYTDDLGQTMDIKGIVQDKNGDTFKDSIVDEDLHITLNYEIICYRGTPKDEYACDVKKFYALIACLKDQNLNQIEGSSTVEITNMNEFNKEIHCQNIPVYVDCYSNACPPCRILGPLFDKFAKECPKGRFIKVALNEVPEIASKYNVESVPTLLIFLDGELGETIVGLPNILKYFNELKTNR